MGDAESAGLTWGPPDRLLHGEQRSHWKHGETREGRGRMELWPRGKQELDPGLSGLLRALTKRIGQLPVPTEGEDSDVPCHPGFS